MKDWMIIFYHIFREANKCADWLAHQAPVPSPRVHIFDTQPFGCINFLYADMTHHIIA